MALPTFLSLVNDVLVRLREPEVTTVNEHVLSKLVGKFVNDAKRQVEDSYDWNALTKTLTATTTADIFNYSLVGTGARFKTIEVYNQTQRYHLSAMDSISMTKSFIGSQSPQRGLPYYFNYNGIDSNGDTQVDVFPIPDGVYNIFFNIYQPQNELATDSSTMLVPKEPVVLLALARGLVERGEDGGLQSSEAYSMYKSALSDYIAIEQSRYPELDSWSWT
jgi:hypothetical protein